MLFVLHRDIMIYGKMKDELEGMFPDDVFVGTMLPAFHPCFILAKIKGFHTIKHWVGTDVYKLRFWHYRLQAKICNLFIDEHCFVNERIKRGFLEYFSNAKIRKGYYHPEGEEYVRKFNILYYCPKKRKWWVNVDWLYGKDIVDRLMGRYEYVDFLNWIILDGTYPKNVMDELFCRADVFLRPTRHDGPSRMVLKAKAMGVPVIHGGGYPMTFDEVESELLDIYEKWSAKHAK